MSILIAVRRYRGRCQDQPGSGGGRAGALGRDPGTGQWLVDQLVLEQALRGVLAKLDSHENRDIEAGIVEQRMLARLSLSWSTLSARRRSGARWLPL